MSKKKLFLTLLLLPLLFGCDNKKSSSSTEKNESSSVSTVETIQLETPIPEYSVGMVSWLPIENADRYEIVLNNDHYQTTETSFSIEEFGAYTFKIKAVALTLSMFTDSPWSAEISFEYKASDLPAMFLATSYLRLQMGETYTIVAKDIDENILDGLTFRGYDISSIVIDDNGVVTPEYPALNYVEVRKDRYKTATMYIEVVPTLSSNLGHEIEMMVGEAFDLDIQSLPALKESDLLTYESSDPEVCFVGDTGIISAVKVGIATIDVACSNGGTTTIVVNVIPLIPATITFTVTIPAALADSYAIYLVGSFNDWAPLDPNYLFVKTDNPLVYIGTFSTFNIRTVINYKYILKTPSSYCWEEYNHDVMANRPLRITEIEMQVYDTVTVWQPEV